MNKNLSKLTLLAALTAACLAPQHAKALSYGQEIPAIFGSGNPSTEWVSDTSVDGNVTVALRARERRTINMPNDGAGLFTFAPGTSVNLDFSFSSKTGSLLDYTFLLSIDNNPSGADAAIVVPTSLFGDNEFDTDAVFGLLGQNSQPFSVFGINTANPGIYNFSLTAYYTGSSSSSSFSTNSVGGGPIASTNIQVQVVSVPDGGTTFIMLGLALLGLGVAKRKFAPAC